MTIDRKAVVRRNNPILTDFDTKSPIALGNGDFAFVADCTGLQSFYSLYEEDAPLCTMSNWAWHEYPDVRSREELRLTEYKHNNREFAYASEPQLGNEDVYQSLRVNPHKMHLGTIAFLWDEKPLDSVEVIQQELDLWTGILNSTFAIEGQKCTVETICSPIDSMIALRVRGEAIKSGRLSIAVEFAYGSHEKKAADWEADEKHFSFLSDNIIRRNVDNLEYLLRINAADCTIKQLASHKFRFKISASDKWECVLEFSRKLSEVQKEFVDVELASKEFWNDFWLNGGMVDFSKCLDSRAAELERRVVLSQYLSVIHSAGSIPPAETGLACNSWYGKFHLEMHPIHAAWFPTWKRGIFLRRSLPWYKTILKNAKANAAMNGFTGARWPKMVGPEGVDSPSTIATLLIWQQAHILWMLEALLRETNDKTFLEDYSEEIFETAEFMVDFCTYDSETEKYHLEPPLIPVQELFDPMSVKDSIFEIAYWKKGLEIAISLWETLEKDVPSKWIEVSSLIADLPSADSCYQAHGNCLNSFESANQDHPAVVYPLGLLSDDRVNKEWMKNTLFKVLESWEYTTLWGWDFGFMAMTATRLGLSDLAIEILLKDTAKNMYVVSGNNYQDERDDLPLYMPGNGSLLLAVGLMCAGYGSNERTNPGFPNNGEWNVIWEDILPFPL